MRQSERLNTASMLSSVTKSCSLAEAGQVTSCAAASRSTAGIGHFHRRIRSRGMLRAIPMVHIIVGLGIGCRRYRQPRRQLALVDAEKIVAPLFRSRSEHSRAGKSAAANLADPIVVAVERGDGIRQRGLIVRIAGEAETVLHDFVADQ